MAEGTAATDPAPDPATTGSASPTAGALHRPPIAAHRLLSDGRSTALVDPCGRVDWWCAPAMDSPPLLWSLLDAEGASAAWRHVRPVSRSPEPTGPVVRTLVRAGGVRVECRDALLEAGGGVALVRLARAEGGDLDLTHVLSAGGFDAPWVEWGDGGEGRVDGRVDGLVVTVDGGRPRRAGRELHTVLTAPPGRWVAVVVGVDAALEADPDRLIERLAAAQERHTRRLAGARLPRHHPERAADALAVLEACTFRPTGAVVAAPTTSLPEVPGADRQFDYRYTWLRDASLAISVAALLGRRGTARRYLSFVHSLAGNGAVPTLPLTDLRGGPVPAERVIDGVAGWAGSRPVRVGNAAAGQLQHDALGFLLEGISVYLQTGGSLDDETWRLVQAVADRAADAGRQPTSGIWELREPRDLVAADIGRWLSLDRAIWISRGWRPLARRRRWKRARRRARDRVVGALRPDGTLPQAYGDADATDASALMVVVFGMLGRGDPRASRLVSTTLEALEVGPFLYRYEPGGDDGFAGQEGAFLPVCWWAVSALAATGRVAEARERAARLDAVLPRLLAEEIDPVGGESLGNAPLVWSHIEAGRALYVLDAAALRRRFGPVALWVWRIARYLRLRWRPDGAGGAG